MRCGRCARLQRAGDKDDLPLFARVAMPELEPDVASAADAAGRAGGRGLSPPASLAEGASGVVPARRSRPARHHAARAAAGHRVRRARHGRGARAGAPAAGHRQGRDLHDAGGRDRHRQHDRVGAHVRDIPPGRDRRAPRRRHRAAAERLGRDPCGGGADRGSDAAAAPAVGRARLRRRARADRRRPPPGRSSGIAIRAPETRWSRC